MTVVTAPTKTRNTSVILCVSKVGDTDRSFLPTRNSLIIALFFSLCHPLLSLPLFYQVLGYVHYYSNGTIAPVVIDSNGVGSFSVQQRIEAENFFSVQHAHKAHDGSGRFFMAGLSVRSELVYQNIMGLEQLQCRRQVEYRYRASAAKSTLVLRGKIGQRSWSICKAQLLPTAAAGDFDSEGSWQAGSCAFSPPMDEFAQRDSPLSLMVSFEGDFSDSRDSIHLDAFAVSCEAVPILS